MIIGHQENSCFTGSGIAIRYCPPRRKRRKIIFFLCAAGEHGKKGVIRYKWAGAPGEKVIDAALDKVIKAAEGNGKNTPK
jgi:hypothetical protein